MSMYGHAAALILTMAAVTFLTRALPFLLFDRGGHVPCVILYLGKVLPSAIIAMLIAFCFRNESFAAGGHGVPALLSVGAVVLLHLWKHNNLISIFGGTALYILLIRFVFTG
jgi:branched-subunit amino acid transport protein AzlD